MASRRLVRAWMSADELADRLELDGVRIRNVTMDPALDTVTFLIEDMEAEVAPIGAEPPMFHLSATERSSRGPESIG